MSSLHFFSVILGIGASFGLLWILESAPTAQRIDWLLAGLLTVAGALIGARLGYVLEHLAYFSGHPDEMAQIWLGGLAWEGAFCGGVLTLPLVAKLWQWPLPVVLDRLSRLVLPLGVAGWAGCWLNGLGYGISLATPVWWQFPMLDESGQISLRTPVQPLAILSLIVFLGVLELGLRTSPREREGLRGWATLFIFSADMTLFTFLRADPAPGWLGLRFESWFAIIYTLLGILGTIGYLLKNTKVFPWRRPIKENKESKPL